MRKSSSRIREEIDRLHEQLKAAETKEAERIGRLALKAGLADRVIDDEILSQAFAELAARFQTTQPNRQKNAPKPVQPLEGSA